VIEQNEKSQCLTSVVLVSTPAQVPEITRDRFQYPKPFVKGEILHCANG
jgi:hypothetical protein